MATDVGTLQSKLTLDFSQFASGMNSAISMVRSFGKQLQKALGSTATQGFSTTNQSVSNLQTSITNLQATAANFAATMQNVNTVLAQFTNVQATTSRMGANMQQTANAASNVAANMQQAAAGANSASSGTRNMSNNTRTAGSNARRTATNTQQVANNANNAAKNANKLSSNLSKSVGFAKDLKRILGGIVVSQAFYKMLGIMQDLVSSSVEFMTNMEQSAISFKYLLGSAENSAGFLEALQDFAISSPMDMQGAEQASRMLMTMGFQAENTIAVLRTLTDAATVAGGEMSDTVNRIALALGQMMQSGTVKMQEVRQLVNANIPIYDILQEELGLTAEQVANIGDEAINSGVAVTAILRGLQKRFGGAGKEMQTTVTGAISAIKDSFYVLFNEVMKGPYEEIRQKLVSLSNAMQYLAQVARQLGAGGVFEAIVPERLQMVIRNVIGAFMQLGQAMKMLGLIAKEIFGGMGEIILHILNIVLPPISILANAILSFAYGLLKTYPIIKYFFAALMLLAIAKPIGTIFLWFWKVIGLGKIIMTIVGYIQTMIKWLGVLGAFMVAHPAVAVITAITFAVLTLTGVLQKAINKIKEFFSMLGAKMSSSNKTVNKDMGIGYDPNDILQPTDKETNDSADKYKASLQDIQDELAGVGDEANKTKNKLKNTFNQSFDEVYAINPDTGSDLGLDGLTNLDLSTPIADIGELNTELGELGGFKFDDSWADSFMESWNSMWEKIKSYLKEFGLGALLAGLLAGLLTGNPWIALAAALAALFWPAIAEKLGLSEADGQKILGAAIGALLGAVIAKICGAGVLTGITWAGIGALLFAGLWPAIQTYISGGTWQESVKALDFTLFGAGLGALIGNLIGGPLGAALGALIGGFIGNGLEGGIDAWVDGGSWQEIVQGINWTTTGTGIGALIGTCIAGPLGAALGAAIGAAIGSGIQGGIDAWANGEDGWNIASACNWTTIGAGIGGIIGTCIAGPIGTAIGAVIGGLVGFIVDKIAEVLAAIDGDWEIAGDAFKLWGKDIKDAFIDGLLGDGGLFGWSSQFFTWAGDAFKDAVDAFKQQDWGRLGKDILEGILEGLAGAITFIFEPIARVFNAIVKAICAIFGIHSPAKEMEPYGANILLGVLEGIVGAIGQIPSYIASAGAALISAIGGWFTGIGEKVTGWFGEAKTSIGTFLTESATNIGNWVITSVASIGTWVSDTASSIGGWVNNRITDFTTWATNTGTSISTWATNAKTNISTWATETASNIGTWVTERATDINTWATNTGNNISTWATTTAGNISTWATNTGQSISTWATNAKNNISTWASNTQTTISNWWTNVKTKFDAFKGVSFTDWCSNTFKTISDWCSNVWSSIKDKIGSAIDKVKEFLSLSSKDANVNASVSVSGSGSGHASGGVFNREHWARFAEGNKAEAIIPLENNSAMQPFVDAVSNGLTASLAPILSTMNNGNSGESLQPLYVGTLVADDKGLKELERRMQIIRVKEERRG